MASDALALDKMAGAKEYPFELDTAIITASIAAIVSVSIYSLGARQVSIDRKRTHVAQAIADLLAWLEIPHRVRRRTDNAATTLNALAAHIHTLQERIDFHENWLRLEMPTAQGLYAALVTRVKTVSSRAIRDAWEADPVADAAGMNLGGLAIDSVEAEIEAFAVEARRRLTVWRP